MSAKKNQPASTPAPRGAKPGPTPGREGYKHTKLGWIPEEWEVKQFGKAFDRVKRELTPERQVLYRELGIKSHGKGLFYKEPKDGEELGEKAVYWVEPDCLIFNIVFAWEQAVARTTHEDNGLIASHRFPMYRAKRNVADLDFVLYFLKTKRGKLLLENASPGGAGRNKTLSQGDLSKSFIPFPPYPEQRRIAAVLGTWDRAIALVKELLAAQQERKRGLMQELLSGKRRFPGFGGKWKEVRLGELGETYPGLSGKRAGDFGAGKPYITYLNIFNNSRIDINQVEYVRVGQNERQHHVQRGDIFFTVSSETPDEVGMASVLLDEVEEMYLNSFCFGFRLESSEVLLPEFARYLLRSISFRRELNKLAQGATRFNLSKKQLVDIRLVLPDIPEQQAIATCLDAAQAGISDLQAQLARLTEQKRGLMQVLLTGEKRVKA